MSKLPILILIVSIMIRSSQADDEIRIMIPAFRGGTLGKNVATVLNLKVWRTLRLPPKDLPYRAGGKVIWGTQTLQEDSHLEAENVAENNGCQMILWGDVLQFGDGILVESFLSIPLYEDLRQDHSEEWSVKVTCDSANVELKISLPTRRYEFAPIVLDKDIVDLYSTPSAIKLFETKESTVPFGVLGDSYTAIQHDGDYTFVKPTGGKPGWVYLPRLSGEIAIVDFAGGLLRLYRGDYAGAIDLLVKVSESESGAGTRLKIDSLLLQALALAKLGGNPTQKIDVAIRLNPYLQVCYKFKIQALAGQYLVTQDSPDNQRSIAKQIDQTLESSAYLFSENDEWFAAARRISDCMLKHSH
jgi:hypothetical protein